MVDNIFSQLLRDQLAKGQSIPSPQVRSVGVVPDARSPIGNITGNRLRGFNARQMAGSPPYIPGARNIGPMPTTPDPRLPMRLLGSATPTAPRSGGGAMGALGLVELGLMGIDQIGKAINPDFARKRNIADEYTAKYGADYSLTPEEMAERLGKNDTTTYSSVPGFIGPVAQPSPGLIGPPVPVVESQKGAWTTKGWDPNAVRTSPQETSPPAPILPPPPESLLPPEERAYQAELARTQQMMASNPYMPQTQLYAQGQSVMQTPEDMAATRDLGLAINRAMYGNQLTPKTPNPLMAGLTPPPGAQSNIPMDQEGRIGQIDTASEGVQEFMRKYLEGKKKREEED
jgi:hypothetical protein